MKMHTTSFIFRPGPLLQFLLLLIVSGASAQNFINLNTQQSQPSLSFRIEPEEKTVDGSPYYNDEWKPGIVYQKNDTYSKLDEMKYDTMLDEIVFKHQGQVYLLPKKTQVDRFQLGDDRFVGAFNNHNEYSFYKVLEGNDSFFLLKKFDCTLKKGEPSKGYIPATNDAYVIEENIYIKKKNQNTMEINPRKGENILSVIDESERAAVQGFIKENKLKMKKIDDLQKVVKFYVEHSSL